jgi:hypothetical protein
VEIQETEMRKFLIVGLGLASLAGVALTGTASAIEVSKDELKAGCTGDGAKFETTDTGYSCTKKVGKHTVQIICGATGHCVAITNSVFNPKSSTHGPVGQAPDTTLGKGGKNSAGASTSGASTLAGGGTSSNGVTTAKQVPLAGVSNTNTSGTTGGGGLSPNGRPRLQQQ